MANAPYYTKTQVDSKIDPLKVDVENLEQNVDTLNQDVYNLQLEVDGIADGTGGKGYATISDAMAVTPLPSDGVLFTIDYDNESERGVYRYDSTVTPEGYVFVRPIIDATGVVEEGNTQAVSGNEVFNKISEIATKTDVYRTLMEADILKSNQIITMVGGLPSTIVHERSGETIRTDTYTFTGNQIVESRELPTGEKVTITTNTLTLTTDIIYYGI